MTWVSDAEIEVLVREVKRLSRNDGNRLYLLKQKRGHDERDIELIGERVNRFRLILRRSQTKSFNFSVILAWLPTTDNRVFRLRKYNGRHAHTNDMEKERFRDFHVHQATERYQARLGE